VILALDTSTAIASIALYDGGSVSAELTWHSGRNHSVELMAQTRNLLRLRRIQPAQLKAIAAAIGPGSYTGLRVGLAAAKGLCLALKVPIIGVCTLDILAEAHRESGLPVRAVLDAGRHRYATALYRLEAGAFRRVSDIEGMRMPEIIAGVSEETLLCGDLGELREVGETDNPMVRTASPASSLRRAGYLAEIASKRLDGGDVENPAQVEAYYLSREGT
jgi:tRNA threonylcarbamoyladenosine biosynthesis protein TsaB